ncbi:MAG: protein nirH [Rhodospirillales bacterium RIFCSPLOWO2_12_FULL_58_28]|nr:MAG: protein nirH [Rhodospirillales bacterium RIFCSPLOWO2_12_FULL_58_28]
MDDRATIDDIDRRIVLATQQGLPLCARPYDAVAEQLSLPPQEVIRRMKRMLDQGLIRRIGVVPNHYTLGYRGNGMAVWDVPDECVLDFGRLIGDLEYVSHCYLRPRHPPEWPYNLFAMVHGHDRDEVMERVGKINYILGDDVRAHEVLFSTRILKKTGLRFSA